MEKQTSTLQFPYFNQPFVGPTTEQIHAAEIEDWQRAEQLLAAKGLRITPVETKPLRIPTSEAIDYFFEVKGDLALKASTEETNRKRLRPFANIFEFLPLDGDTIREQYLSRYAKLKPRYQRNMRDALAELYNVIVPKYHLASNPMAEIGRPHLNGNGGNEPHPLNIKWLPKLVSVAETENELAALGAGLGAGWRPGEYRSIRAIDVRKALYREEPIITIRGKEREEPTPLLPEMLEVLSKLTPSTLGDHEFIIRSRRVRAGVTQPMGEKAYVTMIYSLYRRADIPEGFIPYDLRDTFASLVYKKSRDWWMTERLMRHVLPGEGTKYAQYPLDQLCEDLQQYSPLRQIQGGEFESPLPHLRGRYLELPSVSRPAGESLFNNLQLAASKPFSDQIGLESGLARPRPLR